MRIVRTVGCFLLLGTAMLRADDFGDVIPDDATPVAFDLAAWCDVAGHRFVFEKTPLAEVIQALGGGKLQYIGDGGDATSYVDYSDGTHFIRFSSNDEMGGDDHALQGVEIRPLSASDQQKMLPRVTPPIRFPFGTLAIPLVGLTHELGHANEHDGVRAYLYLRTAHGAAKDDNGKSLDLETQSSLLVRTYGGKIVALSVNRVTSG